MENWDWTHLLKFSVAFYSNHNFTEFSSDLLSGEKKKKKIKFRNAKYYDIIRHYYVGEKKVLWIWRLLEPNVGSMKSYYQSCMTFLHGVPSVYWSFWNMAILICRDSYETLVKLSSHLLIPSNNSMNDEEQFFTVY